MVNKQLVNWIEQQKAKGYTNQQLKQQLIDQGYNQKEIDDFFGSKSKKFILITIILIILLIFGGSIFYYSYYFLPKSESIKSEQEVLNFTDEVYNDINESLISAQDSSNKKLMNASVYSHFHNYKNILQLKIAQEIDEEWKSLLNQPFEVKIPKKPQGYEESWNRLNETMSLLKDTILFNTELGVAMGVSKIKSKITKEQWEIINVNKINGTLFLDGSGNLDDYKIWLENNIDEIYQESIAIPKKDTHAEPFDFDKIFRFESERMEKLRIKTIIELGEELAKLRNNWDLSEIEKLRNGLVVEESKESRVIRLRMLQYFIASELIERRCETINDIELRKDCRFNIVGKTHLYNLCYDEDVECFVYIAQKVDKPDLCNKLDLESDREECLNSFTIIKEETIDISQTYLACKQFETEKDHDFCVMDLVFEFQDPYLCDFLHNDYLYEACIALE